MKRFLVLALSTGLVTGCASLGLSKEETEICRNRASSELNEFSAKQTYNYCAKTIKTELKEQEQKRIARKKKQQDWYNEFGWKEEQKCKDHEAELANYKTPIEEAKPGELNIDPRQALEAFIETCWYLYEENYWHQGR